MPAAATFGPASGDAVGGYRRGGTVGRFFVGGAQPSRIAWLSTCSALDPLQMVLTAEAFTQCPARDPVGAEPADLPVF